MTVKVSYSCIVTFFFNGFLNLFIFGLPGTPAGAPPQQVMRAWFRNVSESAGIRFQHQDGRFGKRYYVETSASGGGWLDYDGDGDLDLYLINGSLMPGSKESLLPRNALYENRGGSFVDVTDRAGVGDTGYGMGICAGDYDGDGLLDFFVTNYGPDRLFRNLGKGAFLEVSQSAGVDGGLWGTNCAFGDLDGDGDLDLYVANYVDFSVEKNPQCGHSTTNTISYCRPTVFNGQNDFLYINQGDGTFREEARLRGIRQGLDGKCFGVVLSDMDDDADLDILVASDGTMNRFYVNDGRGYFEDQSLLSGFGFNGEGAAEAGMGLAAGDVNGDGLVDVMITNYAHETNTLYLNRGGLFFEDGTTAAGLVEHSLSFVGWGVGLFDVDNDTDLDLAVVNGHVIDNIEIIEPGVTYPQPNQLFLNDGKGKFNNVSARAGPVFRDRKVSRGLAVGDWNNDGRLDLLVTNTNDRVDLLENTLPGNHHWVGFVLRGAPVNPFAIGARVRLKGMVREVRSGGSFMSQSDLRLHFGLGQLQGPITVEIRWPDGKKQVAEFKGVDRYWPVSYAPRKN